jgi:hypothetical protein
MLAGLLAGCGLLQREPWQAAEVSRITSEAVAAARAPAPEQRQALEGAKRDYRRDASDANCLRLAAMLATLPEPLRDEPRAAALLKPLASRDGASPYGSLAVLLTAQIAERQRLAREVEQANKDLERSEREGAKREEVLQQQLEALKSIERGIIEREQKSRANRR